MAIVKKYAAKVVSIQNSIEGVYTLEFESLGKPFKYDAGQFLHLAIDEYDPSMQWPDSRCFSMQSAPAEDVIRITYAAKGQFTNRMKQLLEVGKEVTLKLPYGDLFSQEHNKTNTVFIAGGTGITPYLSLFTDQSFVVYEAPPTHRFHPSKLLEYRHAKCQSSLDTRDVASKCSLLRHHPHKIPFLLQLHY